MSDDALSIDGYDGAVGIVRDERGIPKVTASSTRDVFFGHGYVTAQDRTWQIDWDRRRALGRSAALIGTPANVLSDSFHRRARLEDAARAGYSALTEETQDVLVAYAAGVNAGLTRPVELVDLGAEAEPWEPWHSVAVFGVRHLLFATLGAKLWNARVLLAMGSDAVRWFATEPPVGTVPLIVPSGSTFDLSDVPSPDLAAAVEWLGELSALGGVPLPDGEPFAGWAESGSNAWVVHGSRTTTGKPILAGDPHRLLEAPNVYAQVSLTGGDIDVTGFSFPGVPGVLHFGQTPHVAWGITNASVDYQDLFVERLPEAVTDTRTERILVRDGDAVEVTCEVTDHGPLVIGGSTQGIGLALACTGLQHCGGSLDALLPMLRARSVGELDAALSHWVDPANNVVAADADGHISYRLAGKLPDRPAVNQIVPVPGWDPAFAWAGFVADEELPREIDPAAGVIVTANQRIAGGDWPGAPGRYFRGPSRARRIWERLGDRSDLSVADQEAIQRDTVWLPGLALARLLGDAVPADWDGAMDPDSTTAALVGQTFHELARLVAERLPESLHHNTFGPWEPGAVPVEVQVGFALSGWLEGDPPWPIDWPPLIHAALAAARSVVSETTTWGDLHHAFPTHGASGAAPSSGPVGGGYDCVNATMQPLGILTHALFGPCARYVWDLDDPTASRWVVPLGSSGNPDSEHYADQLQTWTAGHTFPI